MKCLRPFFLKDKEGHLFLVKCGYCAVCVEARLKDWFVRLMSESGCCDYSKFLTLTYSDDFLPSNNSLNHEHFQLFIKRLRKELVGKYSVRIKYYMCGEYGSLFDRPHYHAIMFFYVKGDLSKDCNLLRIIQDKWIYGNVHAGHVTPRSVRYCLNYLNKLKMKFDSDDVVKPYQKMSKGLGLSYIVDNEDHLSSKTFLQIGNVKYSYPRYYLDKSESIKSNIRSERSFGHYYDSQRELEDTYWKNHDYDTREQDQIERNINARKNIKRGRL